MFRSVCHIPSPTVVQKIQSVCPSNLLRSLFAPFSSIHNISKSDLTNQISKETTDVLIAGCGIAGCSAALTLADKGLKVTVLSASKNRNNSNSFWAQGGIIYDKGSTSILVDDIMTAGAGLSDVGAAFELAEKGPNAIEELLFKTSKVKFDLDSNGNLDLCLEAAHSVPRIIHHKDQTGKAIMESMSATVASHPNIKLITNVTAVDLIMNESVCSGAFVLDNNSRNLYPIVAQETILATGGLGDIYEHTSNPNGSRGDGIAIALRAGAKVESMEYIQFHPTSLFIPNQNRFLLTEALRGEGAELLTADTKQPFMKNYHDLGNLAPRDIVSRGVFSEMDRTQSEYVWLDISHKPASWIHQRFPAITAECQSHDLDLATGPVPIVPCAHYSCGGITVDSEGQTSLSGLRAVGEVSCTRLHGGNRLASTSLVEGLVWGRNAALSIYKDFNMPYQNPVFIHDMMSYQNPVFIHDREKSNLNVVDKEKIAIARRQLKMIMWEYVGIVRNFEGMSKARNELHNMRMIWDDIYNSSFLTPDLIGLRNAIYVGQVINESAIKNKNSVGAHYRSDALVSKIKCKKRSKMQSYFISNSVGFIRSSQGPKKMALGLPRFHENYHIKDFRNKITRNSANCHKNMSTYVNNTFQAFPSLTIKKDTLIPHGAFAEIQATFLQPDLNTVLKLDKLLKEKNVGVVAHFYMDPELQGVLSSCEWPHIKVADSLVMGDSALKMAEGGVDSIIVLGVDFMSENVQAILRAKGFYIPVYRCAEKSIGCSLAESAEGLNYGAYLTLASKVRNALHVIYINTSLSTKANAHALVPTITCTSSNVVQTVLQAYAQIPECHVFFGPDTYMGENLKELFTYMANNMTDDEISAIHKHHDRRSIQELLTRYDYFKQGICVVHHMFGRKVVDRVRTMHPDACYTAHFEVPGEMFNLAMEAQEKDQGIVGSTSGILDFIVTKVKNTTNSKIKFVLGTEAGMITPIVKAVQEVLSAREDIDSEVEIIFPVSREAMTKDNNFGVVPGVATGEGCSASGGCATCPYMKMNNLDSMMDILEMIASTEEYSLTGHHPNVSSEKVNGISVVELGTIPIHHMRDYVEKKNFSQVLVDDIFGRSRNLEIGKNSHNLHEAEM